MNKKEVYAAYGIEYKTGKIVTPWNTSVSELLKIGTNSKVGDAATFSILPGTGAIDIRTAGPKTRAIMDAAGVGVIYGTCKHDCPGCYAKAGRYNMDGVKASLVSNTIIVYRDLDFFRRAVTAQVIADGIKQVRIHAAGDFFSKEYAAAWARIKADTGIDTAWTYTKEEDALNVIRSAGIAVTPSITPAGINYGTCADVLRMYQELTAAGYTVHVCACGTPYQKHCSDCKTGCKAAGTGTDYTLFIMHSVPGYRAGEKDAAEYAALLDIISRQDN